MSNNQKILVACSLIRYALSYFVVVKKYTHQELGLILNLACYFTDSKQSGLISKYFVEKPKMTKRFDFLSEDHN